MKRIFFGKNYKKYAVPFWEPWGCLGCIGRILAFLLLLILLLLLLSLFRGCCHTVGGSDGDERRSTVSEPGWNQPIEGGEEVGLPAPGDNTPPPFGEMEPVPNPTDDGATQIYPNLAYVIFNSDADDETFKSFARQFRSLYDEESHKIVYYNTGTKTCILEVPESELWNVCEQLPEKITDIDFFAIPISVMDAYTEKIPDDEAFTDANRSWYFRPIQAYEAWDITQGSSDIIVGIVDSYMDLTHPELRGNRCIYPYSVPKGNDDVAPPARAEEGIAGHGTLVTAVAVGNANNSVGSSGIAPRCKFIPVSIAPMMNSFAIIEGTLYCIYHGASVVNLSLGADLGEEITGMPIPDQIKFSKEKGWLQQAAWEYLFKIAERHNTVIVWAAGNENCYDAMDASKRNDNTLRVSAVGRDLKKAAFSNFGNFRDLGLYNSTISAPGVDIWGALPANSYDAWPGTSFSAPIVAGTVALIKSENKDLTAAQIINILKSTGKPVAGAPEIGNLLQIKDALIKAKRTVSGATDPTVSHPADSI